MRLSLGALVLLAAALSANAAPVNDDCANATVIASLPFSDLGVDMTTATTEPGDPISGCGNTQGTNSVWYRLPATAARDLFRGEAGGTGTRYGMRAFTGACGALTEVKCSTTYPDFPEFGVAPEGQEILIEVVNTQTVGTLDFTLDGTEEFLIKKGGRRRSGVGGGPNGFLVVWEAGTGAPGEAQLFTPTGASVGASFGLGVPYLDTPRVAGAGDGSFFVVWHGSPPQAARVDGPGSFVLLPNVSAFYPKVAADDDANFIVVWEGSDGSNTGIRGQRFDRDGNPLTTPFIVNTETTGFQEYPSVAMAPSGQFVVTWEVPDDGSGSGIAARLYDATGTPVAPEFAVNSSTTYSQYFPSVSMDAAGAFVIAWEGGYYYGPPSVEDPIHVRRFDASGSPFAPEFVINTEEYYVSGHLEVASAAAGEFMVGWETYDTPYGASFVDNTVRRFASDGTPQGGQFLVGSYGGYAHYDPILGATPHGDFMVVWNDFRGFFNDNPAGSAVDDAIIGRVFPAPGLGCAPVALTGCRTAIVPLKVKLLLKDEPDDLKDQLRWKFVKGAATTSTDLGDPTSDEDYALCMYDASSATGALLMENRIPAGGTCAGKPCWKGLGNPAGSTGYRYLDKERTPHGVQKIVLKPGLDGKTKIVVKGGQDNVFSAAPGAPPLPLPVPAHPVVVQMQNRSGVCWQAVYDGSGTGSNAPGFFKGSGS